MLPSVGDKNAFAGICTLSDYLPPSWIFDGSVAVLPGKHVDGSDGHVAVDGLPRLDESVQLAVGQRARVVDLEAPLQVAAAYLFQRRRVVTIAAAEWHRRRVEHTCGPAARRDRLRAGPAVTVGAGRLSFAMSAALTATHPIHPRTRATVDLVVN